MANDFPPPYQQPPYQPPLPLMRRTPGVAGRNGRTAAGPLILRTPMVDDDGTGEVGTVVNNDWKEELYNQIDDVVARVTSSFLTPLVSVPYAATNFVASAGTWTVTAPNVPHYYYQVIGHVMLVGIYIGTSTLSTPASYVTVKLPASAPVPLARAVGTLGLWAGSTLIPGMCEVNVNLRDFYITRDYVTNLPNPLGLQASIVIPI